MKKLVSIIMLLSLAVPAFADTEAPVQKPTAEEVSMNNVVDQFVSEGKDISLLKEQLVANQKALWALSDKVEVMMPSGTTTSNK